MWRIAHAQRASEGGGKCQIHLCVFSAPRSAAALTVTASAQDYPTRPIPLIVPFGPGTGSDVLGRVLAQKLSGADRPDDRRRQPPRRSGAMGTELTARSAPDGYTLTLATNADARDLPAAESEHDQIPGRQGFRADLFFRAHEHAAHHGEPADDAEVNQPSSAHSSRRSRSRSRATAPARSATSSPRLSCSIRKSKRRMWRTRAAASRMRTCCAGRCFS